jgi:hypothetical protein
VDYRNATKTDCLISIIKYTFVFFSLRALQDMDKKSNTDCSSVIANLSLVVKEFTEILKQHAELLKEAKNEKKKAEDENEKKKAEDEKKKGMCFINFIKNLYGLNDRRYGLNDRRPFKKQKLSDNNFQPKYFDDDVDDDVPSFSDNDFQPEYFDDDVPSFTDNDDQPIILDNEDRGQFISKSRKRIINRSEKENQNNKEMEQVPSKEKFPPLPVDYCFFKTGRTSKDALHYICLGSLECKKCKSVARPTKKMFKETFQNSKANYSRRLASTNEIETDMLCPECHYQKQENYYIWKICEATWKRVKGVKEIELTKEHYPMHCCTPRIALDPKEKRILRKKKKSKIFLPSN